MADEADKHRFRARHRRGGTAAVVLTALLVLAGFALLAAGLKNDRQNEDDAKKFLMAPLCVSNNMSAAEAAECRLNTPMRVTGKWIDYGPKGHADYCLDLQTYSGDTYLAEVRRGNRVWEAVSVGQVIDTQRWQNHVVSLSVGDLRTSTRRYPAFRPGEVHHSGGVLAGIVLGVFVLFFVLAVVRTTQGK